VTTVSKLFGEAEIAQRVDDMALEITRRLPDDFTMVGLLTGSFVFVADLIRALDRVGANPRVGFVQLSSYGAAKESSGVVRLQRGLPADLTGRTLLLVDDITDSGRTLVEAKRLLAERRTAAIWTCTLLDKPSRREVESEADFIGFQIEDVFVVGYGIDYAEGYRHLPYIGVVD
jgi:hypoxanthine phosphoribosyltransferase